MSRNISLQEAFKMAGNTLVSNKLRSSLTMLGIIIGNASVITLVGLGRGAQTLAKNQLSNLGANVLFIVPGNNDTRRRGISFPKNLVLEDAIALITKCQKSCSTNLCKRNCSVKFKFKYLNWGSYTRIS